MLVAAALAVGLFVGLMSGLTGIGGGAFMVPFLYVVYAGLGVSQADATPLAHATSLTVIVPTALRGLQKLRGTGLVQWHLALPIAATSMIAAVLMAQVATHIPSQALRLFFGGFLVLVAGDLLLRRGSKAEVVPPRQPSHTVKAVFLGVPVGALSAMLGVGGGVPATVGMHYLLKMPFRVIAPTSLAVIAFTGAAGSLSYMTQPVGPLPFGGVVGHVDFLHGLPLAIGAIIAAPLGVKINQRAPVEVIRRTFGVLLLVLGVKLVLENL